LNPLLLAIYFKNTNIAGYLSNSFGLRQALGRRQVGVYNASVGKWNFDNLAFPILLKTRDNAMLNFLLGHPGFVFSYGDFESFITLAIAENWIEGLRTFLLSGAGQFFFSALNAGSEQYIV